MRILSNALDAVSMFVLALRPLLAEKPRRRLKWLQISSSFAWGGGLCRDSVRCFLLGRMVKFAIFNTPYGWLGVGLALGAFALCRKLQNDDLPALNQAFEFADSCASARFMAISCITLLRDGMTTGLIMSLIVWLVGVGGGILNLLASNQKGKIKIILGRWPQYSLWMFVSVICSKLASEVGCREPDLIVVAVLFGGFVSILDNVCCSQTSEISEQSSRIKRGQAFMFKIGLVLTFRRRFFMFLIDKKALQSICQAHRRLTPAKL